MCNISFKSDADYPNLKYNSTMQQWKKIVKHFTSAKCLLKNLYLTPIHCFYIQPHFYQLQDMVVHMMRTYADSRKYIQLLASVGAIRRLLAEMSKGIRAKM
jgi:hypothetical protein